MKWVAYNVCAVVGEGACGIWARVYEIDRGRIGEVDNGIDMWCIGEVDNGIDRSIIGKDKYWVWWSGGKR